MLQFIHGITDMEIHTVYSRNKVKATLITSTSILLKQDMLLYSLRRLAVPCL